MATAGDDANHVDASVCWACACGDVVGPGVSYRDAIVSAPPNHRTPVGTSLVYDAVYRAPMGGDVAIIGQNTLREKLGNDVMAQLKASVLKAHGREDGPEMESTAGDAVIEPNAGAVVRAVMAVKTLRLGDAGVQAAAVEGGPTLDTAMGVA